MADTRDRLLTATGELFRRQGYNGTSMKQVTVAAGVPFGSLYHYFPGGKAELGDAVIRSSGLAYQQLFEVIYDSADDPAAAVSEFFDGAAAVLEETGYIDACPIGTVALEVASTNDTLREATTDVFEGWIGAAVERLVSAGIDPERARELGTALVAGVEGGFMLSRAAKSPEPMRTVGRLMRQLVETELASAGQPRTASGSSADERSRRCR